MQTINLCALCVLCGQEKSRLIQHRARRAETRRGAARIIRGRRCDGDFRIDPEPGRDAALARPFAVERNLARRIEDDVVDEPQELVHLLGNKRRRKDVRLAAEVVVPVLRLEERTRRSAGEILRAERIYGCARKRLLRKEYLDARPVGDSLEDLQVALQRRLVDDVSRHQGTFTGSNVSFHGRPCLLSSAMNGSGSNSSQVWTPLAVHLPSRNILAPIIAGTPVV